MSGGGAISQVAAMTPREQNAASGAAYTPVQQGPVYRPQYDSYQPQARMAQPQQQQQMPNYQSGLQAAMMHMMQQYSRPAMRAPLQQGLSPSSPMAYRPTMPTDNLSRIASPVPMSSPDAPVGIVSPGGDYSGG
jgi:hypothetical protein